MCLDLLTYNRAKFIVQFLLSGIILGTVICMILIPTLLYPHLDNPVLSEALLLLALLLGRWYSVESITGNQERQLHKLAQYRQAFADLSQDREDFRLQIDPQDLIPRYLPEKPQGCRYWLIGWISHGRALFFVQSSLTLIIATLCSLMILLPASINPELNNPMKTSALMILIFLMSRWFDNPSKVTDPKRTKRKAQLYYDLLTKSDLPPISNQLLSSYKLK